MVEGVGGESLGASPIMRSLNRRLVDALLVAGLIAYLAAPVTAQGMSHVVRPGDTLALIAESYGTSIDAIARANALASIDIIWVGQELAIPIGSSLPTVRQDTDSSIPMVHVVALGDTLADIALSYSVSPISLIEVNGIENVDLLWVGQKLLIPGSVTQRGTPTPQPPTPRPVTSTPMPTPTLTLEPQVPDLLPTPTPIAADPRSTAKPETPEGDAITPTVQPTPASTQTPMPSKHVVQPGETLGRIAGQYGTTAAALARLNGLTSPDLIYVGFELLLPRQEWTTTIYPGRASRFVASISQQRCWLYQGNVVIGDWLCSTGQPGTATQPGTYAIQSKMEKAFGSTWNIWMPYWLGIYWAGASENGIHGIPYDANSGWRLWDGYVGTPVTYGCILLDDEHAAILYDKAYIGMPIIIQP